MRCPVISKFTWVLIKRLEFVLLSRVVHSTKNAQCKNDCHIRIWRKELPGLLFPEALFMLCIFMYMHARGNTRTYDVSPFWLFSMFGLYSLFSLYQECVFVSALIHLKIYCYIARITSKSSNMIKGNNEALIPCE